MKWHLLIFILFVSYSSFAEESDELKPDLYEECKGPNSPEAAQSHAKRLREIVVEDLTSLSAKLGVKADKAKDLVALDVLILAEWDRVSNSNLEKTTLTQAELDYVLANLKKGSEWLRTGRPVDKSKNIYDKNIFERDLKRYFKDVERYYLNELSRLGERVGLEFSKLKVNEMIQKKLIKPEMISDRFLTIMEDAIYYYNNLNIVFDVKKLEAAYKNYKVFTAKQVQAFFKASKIPWKETLAHQDRIIDILAEVLPMETARDLYKVVNPEFRGAPTCCLGACQGCPNSRGLRNEYDPNFRR